MAGETRASVLISLSPVARATLQMNACLLLLLLVLMAPVVLDANEVPRDSEKVTGDLTQSEQQWRRIDATLAANPGQSVKDAEQALHQAQQRGDKRGQLEALRRLCRIGSLANESSPVRKYIDSSVALARELDDMDALGWLLFMKSELQYYDGERSQSAPIMDEATLIAEQHRLNRLLAWIYVRQGERLFNEARHSDAMALFFKAHALFEAQRDNHGMAMTLSGFAYVFDWDDARDEYKAARYNGEEKTAELDQIRPHTENSAKAIEYLSRALTLIDPDVYQYTAMLVYHRLGSVYNRLRDRPRAIEFFQKGLPLARRLGMTIWISEFEYRIAAELRNQRRYDEALARLDVAWQLASKAPELVRVRHRVLLERANIFSMLGRKDESLAALAQTQPIIESILRNGEREDLSSHYTYSASIYAKLGDHRNAYRQMTLMYEQQQRYAAAMSRKQTDEYKVRFDVQLKEAENALLRSQQREAGTRRVALTLALVSSVLLLGGVAFLLHRRAAAARIEAGHHRALAEAEAKANQAKGTFLANMSHELCSPLNAMLGFSQLLMRDTSLREDTRNDVATIYKSGDHLYTLINQVLDLSKIEGGYAALNNADFDLYVLLDELAEMFAITARQKGLRLAINNAPEVPQYIRADALKLRQVLINLLNNAIKFTTEGSVSVDVSAKPGQQDSTHLLSFVVSDTGPGISADELSMLGNAFVQAKAGQQAREGTGLGLAISSGFVGLMGGKLQFASELGRGTTVAFDIPVQSTEAGNDMASRKAGNQVIGLVPGQPNYRILAVDDRPEGRQLLSRLLTPLGFDVREAANGQEAIDIWEAWAPHLIWMDMRMPMMDGREATRRIKATDKGKDTFIIAFTASSFEEERAQILADGCDDFLRKPFREEILFELMHKHLGAQFIYEGAPATDTKQPMGADAVTMLTPELRAQLTSALTELDVNTVERLIETIRHHDQVLADTLAQMAYRYEYDRMLDLVKANEFLE